MQKGISLTVLFIILIVGLQNCKSSDNARLKQTVEEILDNGIVQHFNETSHDADTDGFVSYIGNTMDKVEFKEYGEVYLRLFKHNQVFNITQLQRQHRLSGLKNFIQKTR